VGIASDGLMARQEQLDKKLKELAYERLRLTRRVEQIDDTLTMLQAAGAANALMRTDLDTEAAIAEAQAATEPHKEGTT